LELFDHASKGYKMNGFSIIEQMTPFDQWWKKVQIIWFFIHTLFKTCRSR